MENTLENKAKLFAQYWGQRVGNFVGSTGLFTISQLYFKKSSVKQSWLELKPLSSIRDEELTSIVKFYEPTAHNVKLEDNQIEFDFIYGDQGSSGAIEISDGYCLDWLRSNGFATEWMGLSVENLVSFGWIKLKNTES